MWDSSCESPRAYIILKRNLEFICPSEFQAGALVTAEVSLEAREKLDGQSVRIFPRKRHQDKPELVLRLTKFCERRALPLLLGWDTNPHEIWGNSDINRRSGYFLEFIINGATTGIRFWAEVYQFMVSNNIQQFMLSKRISNRNT